MYRLITILCITVAIAAASCSGDNKHSSTESPAPTSEIVNNATSDNPAEKADNEQPDYEQVEIKEEEDTKPVESISVTEMAKQNEQVKQAVETSFNAKKSCQDILADYEAFLKELGASMDQKQVETLRAWANDPLYNDCYSNDPAFRSRADELDEEYLE